MRSIFIRFIFSSFLCCLYFIGVAQQVQAPLLETKIAEEQAGNFVITIPQQELNALISKKITTFLRRRNPQNVSIDFTEVRYFENRGWQLFAKASMDNSNVSFLLELVLIDGELKAYELSYQEVCISASCDDMEFVSVQDGGCVCNNSSSIVEYLFRTTQR